MSATPARAATAVWLVLTLATGLSWLLGHGDHDRRAGSVAVIVIAAFKIRLVLLWFMELRHAPWPWRAAFEAWAVVVPAIMVGFYLLA